MLSTLRKIAGTAEGSVALESRAPFWRYVRAGTWFYGEPLKFGVDNTPPLRDRLSELLASCGLTLDRHRTLGPESDGERAWGGFATAIVAK